VQNVHSHFFKIIWFFCDRLMDKKYITIPIFINLKQNLDIITIIIF
jgi:hypothetical protein